MKKILSILALIIIISGCGLNQDANNSNTETFFNSLFILSPSGFLPPKEEHDLSYGRFPDLRIILLTKFLLKLNAQW